MMSYVCLGSLVEQAGAEETLSRAAWQTWTCSFGWSVQGLGTYRMCSLVFSLCSLVLSSACCVLLGDTYTHTQTHTHNTHTAPKMAEVTGVNSVARNTGGNVLAVALDFGVIALYRFPCPYVGTKNKRYAGHSAGVSKVYMRTHTLKHKQTHTHTRVHVWAYTHTHTCDPVCIHHTCAYVCQQVCFTKDDKYLISIGALDRCIMQWEHISD